MRSLLVHTRNYGRVTRHANRRLIAPENSKFYLELLRVMPSLAECSYCVARVSMTDWQCF